MKKFLLIGVAAFFFAAVLYFTRAESQDSSSATHKDVGQGVAAADSNKPAQESVANSPTATPLLPGLGGSAAPVQQQKQASVEAAKFKDPPSAARPSQIHATVNVANRAWNVLDGRGVVSGAGQQATLVLQDLKSGQLEYRQSALRFVLNPGEDYEAFIRSLPHTSRRYVNVLYGEINIPVQHIGAVYSEIAADARVSKVQFIPLDVPAKPR